MQMTCRLCQRLRGGAPTPFDFRVAREYRVAGGRGVDEVGERGAERAGGRRNWGEFWSGWRRRRELTMRRASWRRRRCNGGILEGR